MNLASIGGPASDVKPRKSGSCANRFETGLDLLFDVAKNREDLMPAHVDRSMTGDLFRGPVKSNDVSKKVGCYQTAAHTLDDAIIEQAIIGEIPCGACELDFTATDSLGELARQYCYCEDRDQVEREHELRPGQFAGFVGRPAGGARQQSADRKNAYSDIQNSRQSAD